MSVWSWREPYGALTVGRVTVTCPWEISTKTGSGSGRVVTLSGQSSSQTFTPLTQPQIRAQAEALMAYAGQVVPVVFTGFPHLDGWYRVGSPGADESTWRNFTAIEWSLDMVLVGRDADVEIESRLVGGNRVHATAAVPELWHAPAVAATGYMAGTGASGWVDRVSASGTVRVYRGLPAKANPRWGCRAATGLAGAAQVVVDGDLLTGTTSADTPGDWSVSNGLIRVEPRQAAGTFRVTAHLAASWGSPKVFDVKRAGVSLGAATHVTVLRNDPCECVVRLTYDHAPGRSTIDIAVKRGARHAALFCQQSTVAGAWRVDDNGGGGVVSDQLAAAGYIERQPGDANGNFWVLGATVAVTAAGTFGFQATVPAASLPCYVGVVYGGASAQAGDGAAQVNAQYLGTPGELEQVIAR